MYQEEPLAEQCFSPDRATLNTYVQFLLLFIVIFLVSFIFSSGSLVAHVRLKRKREESQNEVPAKILAKRRKVIIELEMHLLEGLNENVILLRTAQGEEHQRTLENIKTLSSVHKKLGLNCQRTREAFSAVHTEVLDAKLGDSITLTLKCVSACHLRALMSSLDSLEVALMEDLKQLPGCHGYDLTDLFIKIDISDDMFKECEKNLKECE